MSDLIKRDRALRAIAIAESKETAYDAVSGIEPEKTEIGALKEIDEILSVDVKLLATKSRPSDYDAGLKDAYESFARTIHSYLEDING